MSNNSGIFKIWVKPSEDTTWGVLQAMPYDNAISGKKRRAILKAARACVRGWRYNYAQFVNAAFAIEEQDDLYSPPVHLEGQKRGKVWGGGQLKRKVLKPELVPEARIKRKVLGARPPAKRFVPTTTVVEYEAAPKTTRKLLPKKISKDRLRAIRRHYRKRKAVT